MDGCTAHSHNFTQVYAQCEHGKNTQKELHFPQFFLSIASSLQHFSGPCKTFTITILKKKQYNEVLVHLNNYFDVSGKISIILVE